MESIYDLPSQTSPILGAATPAAAPGGILGLLGDRNFLQLLVGIGSNLDPKGAGGIIGGPTRTLIASQAAQERADKTALAQNAQTKMVIEALRDRGGLTPQGTPGVTSFKATPKGSVQMEVDPPGAEATTGAVGPAVPVTPGAVAPTETEATTGSVGTARSRINSLLPFYSALLE